MKKYHFRPKNYLPFWRKPPMKWLGLTLLGLFIIWFVVPFILSSFGKTLVVNQPLQKADVAIVLSGDEGPRIEKAVWLYKHKYVKKIIMNGGGPLFDKYYANFMGDYAIRLGIPEQAILMEKHSLSTWENARFVRPLLEQYHFNKAIIITSNFHTRRSWRVFKKAFRGSSITLSIIGVDDGVNYNKWWHSHEACEKVLTEWCKTVIYWIKY